MRPVLEGVMPGEAEGALRLPFSQGHADAWASWGVWRLGPWILPLPLQVSICSHSLVPSHQDSVSRCCPLLASFQQECKQA